jgi:hypothetical protein
VPFFYPVLISVCFSSPPGTPHPSSHCTAVDDRQQSALSKY